MKKIFYVAMAVAATMLAVGCGSMGSSGSSLLSMATKPTTAEISSGLKEALMMGVNMGIDKLAAKDGYYNDVAVRIGLPQEALVITKNISKLPGGQKLVDSAVKSINAAATDAVKDAAPIFLDAITSMTFTDAAKILAGDNHAATTYFKGKTKPQLKNLFASRIKKSMDKKLVGDVSASSSWNTLTSKWNSVAGTIVGRAAGLTTVNTDLTDYLTDQAVDGLFVKVAEQEQEIRTKASARTTPLLKRVFGHR
ncbi:MAG: DUF4197 domain-containing protein [Bacteroidales bacterium]|nr:DUF4197 domain-containing protein [Bacteroidales bacterium]